MLSGTLQVTTNATAASAVDEYKIKPSGVASNNYDIKFVEGTLAVTPAALTVRAADTNKIYGAELPAFTAGYDGFVLGETVDALGGSLHFDTDATKASAVGTYDVTPSGLHSHNYAIDFVAGTLTVSPAPLAVRADDKTKVYGAPLPALTASYDGFVLHDGPGVLEGSLVLSDRRDRRQRRRRLHDHALGSEFDELHDHFRPRHAGRHAGSADGPR